tara:strand:+ start:21539 stop:22198 length:660 start_codon:yes stop_codon:yes gene_type:complete
MKIIGQLKKRFEKFKNFFLILFKRKKILYLNRYDNYSDYVEHQKNKTTDPEKIKKWFNDEWDLKYNGFVEIFQRNQRYLRNKNNAICLGSRTGQEVKALIDLGLEAIGLDLVAFPPYTIQGDIHNINKSDNSIDLVFTNIFDHSLYPEKFCNEMERICRKKGHIIIHFQKGIDGDEYSENLISDPQVIISYFKNSFLCESKKIKNSFDLMNWEIVFKKD